jgi:hypothetical protein
MQWIKLEREPLPWIVGERVEGRCFSTQRQSMWSKYVEELLYVPLKDGAYSTHPVAIMVEDIAHKSTYVVYNNGYGIVKITTRFVKMSNQEAMKVVDDYYDKKRPYKVNEVVTDFSYASPDAVRAISSIGFMTNEL